MKITDTVGLPWLLVKKELDASGIPYKTEEGKAFNRFFPISLVGYYIGRVQKKESGYTFLLYRPMVYSEFETCKEVTYVNKIIWDEVDSKSDFRS